MQRAGEAWRGILAACRAPPGLQLIKKTRPLYVGEGGEVEDLNPSMMAATACRAAGLNHLHLLPTYDFATVPERKAEQQRVMVRNCNSGGKPACRDYDITRRNPAASDSTRAKGEVALAAVSRAAAHARGRLRPQQDLSSYPPDSPEQQVAVLAVADNDGFNWGCAPSPRSADCKRSHPRPCKSDRPLSPDIC
jgi:hypothetical protein